jgi:DNA invertase Pin-like site-specific DNA recombinase
MNAINEAIIYARFSKADQVRGHSIERQTDNALDLCRANGWATDPTRIFVEKGKSAFTGANRVKGTLLATLEREIEAGAHRERVLVVEHLDRISRQGWEEVFAFLKTCSESGVSVATHDGARVYYAGERIDMGKVIEVIVKSELSREESAKKSGRILKSFAAKREKAATEGGRNIASRPPSWIAKVPGGFELIEERAAIVREAHRLALAGYGTAMIAKHFNALRIPTWRASSDGWHESYVGRMLNNRAAIGEYVSPTHGDRIVDYYPSCVSVDTFNRVQAARATRRTKGAGPRGIAQANLFSGLLKCSECGAAMNMSPSRRMGRVEKRKSRAGHPLTNDTLVAASYLSCKASRRRLTNPDGSRVCTNSRTVRYEYIEPTILNQVLNVALDTDSFNVTELSQTRIALAEAERQIDAKTEQAANLAANLADTVSPTLMARLVALEEEIAAMKAERDTLRRGLSREAGAPISAAVLQRIHDTREKLSDPDIDIRRDARVLVADALKSVITSIQCDARGYSVVSIACGLAAFEMDPTGKITQRFDGSGNPEYVASLSRGALRANGHRVAKILQRAHAG